MCTRLSRNSKWKTNGDVSHTTHQQTFKLLTMAVLLAAYNVSLGYWKKGVMDTCLRTCVVARSPRDLIWIVYHPASVSEIAPQLETTIPEQHQLDDDIGDGYALIVGDHSNIVPSLWYSPLMLNAYLDCGMYLLFHSIVAYCVERI